MAVAATRPTGVLMHRALIRSGARRLSLIQYDSAGMKVLYVPRLRHESLKVIFHLYSLQ